MLIIGEKLNSTMEKVRKIIEERDVKSIQELALRQVEAGAHLLDVNSSAALGDKEENMEWLVKTVQEAAAIPLCIDSPNPEEIERGLAVHNGMTGKPFLNSLTAEKEKIEKLLPIIKRYQCAVVALVMDESGIPENVQTRIEIASKLINILTDSGIPLREIYIDPLVVPLGTNDQNGLMVLNTIRGVKELYPDVKTVIGLSNISYGLPERKLINQIFMVLAMSTGLDAAIIDPSDRGMMAMIKTTLTLMGKDSYCGEYLKAYREGKLTF